MTLLYTDPLFLEHHTGAHPERAARLTAISERLAERGLDLRCTPRPCVALPTEHLIRVHTPDVLPEIAALVANGGGRLDADTVVSPQSLTVALTAAGTCAAAVSAVLTGTDPTALCLVRPPGHHATADTSMGFCLFNSVALAARHAQVEHGVQRILIVDWDVHHGNGTQDIFYADADVFFLSLHRFGPLFYPGTGDRSETGTGAGLGTTCNVPLAFGTGREEYHDRFDRALAQACAQHRPELILLSAGFDAHVLDPVGGLCLEAEDYATLTRTVRAAAQAYCGGRVVSCLEGGYHLAALADSVAAHLEELLRP
jgi:acetoin utilization deacetylase AcuC-like enzyme